MLALIDAEAPVQVQVSHAASDYAVHLASAERADRLVSECRLEFFQYVEYGRRATLDPEGTPQSYAMRIVECLQEQEAGLTINEVPGTEDELVALIGIGGAEPSVPVDVYIGCTRDAQVP